MIQNQVNLPIIQILLKHVQGIYELAEEFKINNIFSEPDVSASEVLLGIKTGEKWQVYLKT